MFGTERKRTLSVKSGKNRMASRFRISFLQDASSRIANEVIFGGQSFNQLII